VVIPKTGLLRGFLYQRENVDEQEAHKEYQGDTAEQQVHPGPFAIPVAVGKTVYRDERGDDDQNPVDQGFIHVGTPAVQ